MDEKSQLGSEARDVCPKRGGRVHTGEAILRCGGKPFALVFHS
jgi:hypothetical protein